MSYLFSVGAFGAAVTLFLWLRDSRIYLRTGLAGYRTRAHQGVLYTALALLGAGIAGNETMELVGLGVVLLALYLQGRVEHEQVWTSEETISRLLGAVRRRQK